VSQQDGVDSKASAPPKLPDENPLFNIITATLGALFLATILAVPASFIMTFRLEINPYLVLLLFFALLMMVPLIVKMGKPLAVAYLLASLIGTVAVANRAFSVGYMEGALDGRSLRSLYTPGTAMPTKCLLATISRAMTTGTLHAIARS